MFKVPRTNAIMSAMVASLAIILIDQAAVPVALPTIQQEFNASFTHLNWIINAYLLMLASGIIIAGKLGDVIGYKKMLFFGLAIFSLSSIGIGFTNSINGIIAFRAIQGIGGACMTPMVTAIVVSSFPETHRGRAMGFMFGITSLFFVAAPILGGLFTSYLNWRYIFWINVPITLYAFFITQFSYQFKQELRVIKLDYLGFLFGFICFTFLLLSIIEMGSAYYSYSDVFNSLLVFVIFLLLLIWREKKQLHGIIDYRLFKNAHFRLSMIGLFCVFLVITSSIFWVLFFQYVLAADPMKAGLMMAPGLVPIIIMAPLSGWLRDIYGPKIPSCIGAINMMIALSWTAIAAWWHNYWLLFPGLILFGASTSMMVGSFMQMAVSVVPQQQRGEGTGLAAAARPFANAIGFALYATLVQKLNFHALDQSLATAGNSLQQLSATKIAGLLAGTASAHEAIRALPTAQAVQVHQFAIHAYTLGFSAIMWLAAFLSFIILLITFKMPKNFKNLI